MEFLAWVDAVWGEEGHIQASILEKRNILPQHQSMDREPQLIDLTPGIDPSMPFGSLSHWPCTKPTHLKKERRVIPQIHSLGWPPNPILLSNPTIPLI